MLAIFVERILGLRRFLLQDTAHELADLLVGERLNDNAPCRRG